MSSRVLAAVAGVAALLIGVPATAWADPLPTPDLPNINAYGLVPPSDFAALGDRYYAFGTSDGLTCAINRNDGSYGCSGPISGAPDNANLVSGGGRGPAGFTVTERPIFANLGPVKPLPPRTRLSFRSVSCGTDGAGFTACVNLQDQTGFVISPGNSYLLGDS